MKKMSSKEIISTYINFFKEKEHEEIPSASLIPKDDPSILWVNAGVTPLKKFFDGTKIPSNRKMVSCQKCIRTNDIENVGITARHHTFFQMLGNFSIGDYFKKEAITWAFELLTSEKYFGFDKEKLYMTVYTNDEATIELWKSLGVSETHIIKLDTNYWEIGEGPCGPDSEIFYDRGSKYDKNNLGIKLLKEEIENDRYIEIWNNVFSQYNAVSGKNRNEYKELPNKNIDTGMGLERMACILQDTKTNYETDLFLPIINEIEKISSVRYTGQKEFKIIADHIRCITFAISDGATFENYGRGYVLRRLLRRSIMKSRKLNINRTFLSDLVEVVMKEYQEIYPDILAHKAKVKELVTKEEDLFHKTLISGEKKLKELLENNKIITGMDAFKLYDTYGFPIELTIEIAKEFGVSVNQEEFYKYMAIQKEMSRNNRNFSNNMNLQNEALINFKKESTFIGYDKLGNKTKIIGIIQDNKLVEELFDEGYIFLEENPFYAESGGQVSDIGYLKNDTVKAEVLDVVKAPNKQHLLHVKVLSGSLKNNDEILTHVLKTRREEITKNHSAVHLLQRTLKDILGDEISQAGSRIDEKSFRFDFNYSGRINDKILLTIEEFVNDKIENIDKTDIEYLPLSEAKSKGAIALFEEKYEDIVRVVTIGDSIELCGGTHVKTAKEIGRIAIVSLENKGSNIYRITGTTTNNIKTMLKEEIDPYQKEISKLLTKVKRILNNAKKEDINIKFDYNFEKDILDSYKDVIAYKDKLTELKEKIKYLEKEYKQLKQEKTISDISIFESNIEKINDINTLIAILEDYDIETIKKIAETIINKYENCFVLLANIDNNHVNIISKTTTDKINCGKIIKELSVKCKGNGGGSKTFAQGGGSDATNISEYLIELKENLFEL